MRILLLGMVLMIFWGCQSKTETETSDQTLNNLRDSANLLYNENKYFEAVNAYDNLIKFDSLSGELYFRRAYSLCQINKHQNSVPDYLKSAELGFKEFDSYYSLGILYMTVLLDDSLSVKYFQKCLEIDPNSERVKNLLKEITEKNKQVVL